MPRRTWSVTVLVVTQLTRRQLLLIWANICSWRDAFPCTTSPLPSPSWICAGVKLDTATVTVAQLGLPMWAEPVL